MKKAFIITGHIICILIAIALFTIFRPPKNQKEWIEHQIREMASFSPDMHPMDIKTNSLQSTRIFLDEYDEHYFEFQDGNWVYVRVHSFHTDHYWKDLGDENFVGDISISIDKEGNVYKSKEHVCGWFYDEYARGYDYDRTNDTFTTVAPTNFMRDLTHFFELWPWKQILESQPEH